MKKIKPVDVDVLKEIAAHVHEYKYLLSPTELERIGMLFLPSRIYKGWSYLFERFVKSKQIELSENQCETFFQQHSGQYFINSIITFKDVSQKKNNQIFFVSLITKFKGLSNSGKDFLNDFDIVLSSKTFDRKLLKKSTQLAQDLISEFFSSSMF